MPGLLVYLIGSPGSGKTTVMEALNRGRTRGQHDGPVPYMTLQDAPDGLPPAYIELGRKRASFSGTDAMALNVQNRALAFLETCAYTLVLGEGDRLANNKFFAGARERGWTVKTVWLDTPESLATLRRFQRGSKQSPAWVAGRVTKAHKLGMSADLVLHGAMPAMQNANHLRGRIRQWLLARYG